MHRQRNKDVRRRSMGKQSPSVVKLNSTEAGLYGGVHENWAQISQVKLAQTNDEADVVQYQIKSTHTHKPKSKLERCMASISCFPDDFTAGGIHICDYIFCGCYSGSGFLTDYLYWSFRTSFFMLFTTSFLIFIGWVLFFAILMMIFGMNNPECFSPNFDKTLPNVYVNEMFMLSWTTLSTVGYGNIYPSLGSQLSPEINVKTCSFLSLLCSVEAFVGILYGGFVGAIMFGKIVRLQSHAQVIFSDPIVIRYGSGVPDEIDCEKGFMPCPILEFRCINKLHDKDGGEVFDATLNCVAILNPESKTKFKDRRKSTIMLNSQAEFVRVNIGTQQNPFFKRSWLAQHKLDEQSPLLSSAARKLIEENNGYWPSYLNSVEGVKHSLRQFTNLSVTFSGVCNFSAASVYENKLYCFSDVNIGYQFVKVLHLDDDNDIEVDCDLINDVLEQDGGGGDKKLKDTLSFRG